MTDYIVRATAGNAQIRAFAATAKDTVEAARAAHSLSPVASAALGRTLIGTAMMGAMLKGENELVTVQIKGDGPIGQITATSDAVGRVKGYVHNPSVMLPPNAAGKLDVGGAVGRGMLQVIKDMGLKEPYCGQTVLQTGEIAEDLTYYFASSEQVPSSVGLGVLMDKETGTVRQAGGFIIQLMPFAEDAVIETLEKNLTTLPSVTAMLDEKMTPEQMLEKVLDGLEVTFTDTLPLAFHCNCSKERVEKALISVGEKEIKTMIAEGKPIEVNCHFCNKNYSFSIEELHNLLKRAK
ncbi:MAG: Hsp33 family molecular chaperone HslO [Lachnospiraceae bacterium]|nr:Hsp33 family molecular chaperone HslO [Lachnospiraceae bacterium]